MIVRHDGRQGVPKWVRKREQGTRLEPLLAEAVGWLLGRRLEVPIPEAAVCESPEIERSWLSSYISPIGHWDAAHATKVTNYDGLGRMLTLDVLINNADRHAGNILLQPLDALHIKAWAIDAGTALIGSAVDYQQHRSDLPMTNNHARGLPLELLREHALQAAQVAAGLTDRAVGAFVLEACEIARDMENAGIISEVLAERCKLAPTLVSSYLSKLERVQ